MHVNHPTKKATRSQSTLSIENGQVFFSGPSSRERDPFDVECLMDWLHLKLELDDLDDDGEWLG